MREIYWQGDGPFNGLIKGEASHTRHLLYCCRSFRCGGGSRGVLEPPMIFCHFIINKKGWHAPSTKQTRCVISQGVQKCTECKRGSHAHSGTNWDSNIAQTSRERQRQTRTHCRFCFQTKWELKFRVTTHVKPNWLSSVSLLCRRFPQITPNTAFSPGSSLSIRFDSLSQVLVSLASHSDGTSGTCGCIWVWL